MLYQEAIENNFSHEQMTPLNCIKNFTAMVREMLETIKSNEHQISSSLEEFQESLISNSLPLPAILKLEEAFNQVS